MKPNWELIFVLCSVTVFWMVLFVVVLEWGVL